MLSFRHEDREREEGDIGERNFQASKTDAENI